MPDINPVENIHKFVENCISLGFTAINHKIPPKALIHKTYQYFGLRIFNFKAWKE